MRMKFMMSCKEATEISNKIQDNEPISLFKKIEFKFHTFMCKLCSIYDKQNAQLNKLLGKLPKDDIPEISLSEESKETLKKKLKDKQ
ncbi:MAG: hypothetical protein ACPG6V_07730 [Flavobacteriales bacterium]